MNTSFHPRGTVKNTKCQHPCNNQNTSLVLLKATESPIQSIQTNQCTSRKKNTAQEITVQINEQLKFDSTVLIGS